MSTIISHIKSEFRQKCTEGSFWQISGQLESPVLSVRTLEARWRQYILGEFAACMRSTARAVKNHEFFYAYHGLGKHACKTVFIEVHELGGYNLRTLQDLTEESCAQLSAYGSAWKTPHNVIPPPTVESTVAFIRNIASICSLPQPAAPRGREQVAPTYLPTARRKKFLKNILRPVAVKYYHTNHSAEYGGNMQVAWWL